MARPSAGSSTNGPKSSDAPISVLVGESDAEFLAAIGRTLTTQPRLRVVARTGNAAETIQRAIRSQPDLCLLEVEMPGGGVPAAWEIRSRLPWTKIVLLSAKGSDEDLFTGLRGGIDGFLLKDMNLERLPHALIDVWNGNAALPRNLATRVLRDYRGVDPTWRSVASDGLRGRVTSREWEVLELLSQGLSTYEIAQRLFVTSSAVRCHISSAVRKLGASNRREALQLLRRGAA